jgi:hypothetical protein
VAVGQSSSTRGGDYSKSEKQPHANKSTPYSETCATYCTCLQGLSLRALTRPELPHPCAAHERIPFTSHQAPKQDATCKLSASVLPAILREPCHWMSPGLGESGY